MPQSPVSILAVKLPFFSSKQRTLSPTSPTFFHKNMTMEEPIDSQMDALSQEVIFLAVSQNLFVSGPVFDPNRNGKRMRCNYTWGKYPNQRCSNESEPNFFFQSYFCPSHCADVEEADARWIFQCVHIRDSGPNGSFNQCKMFTYRILHQENQQVLRTFRAVNPIADKNNYRCMHHVQSSNGLLFRSQHRRAAGNIKIIVNGVTKDLVSRQRLQGIATRIVLL